MQKITVLLGLVLCFFTACQSAQQTPQRSENTDRSMLQSKTYLALGDSYTIGEAVKTQLAFPYQLVDKLNAMGQNYSKPQIIATTGWTTDELLAAIDKEKFSPPYDLVTLLIGVNNQYRSYPIEQYKKEFEELLQIALKMAGDNRRNVMVVSIPDYGKTPFAKEKNPEKIAKELAEYNQINREISQKYLVRYANITAISEEAAKDSELTAKDNLHPSGKMYRRWVDEVIFPQLLAK